ncbi:putative L-cysteine desulfhydrase 1 [Zingiber officinale]|nr:putative L-cysteine desulfhydrase 1 [Zingiber officinale]
MDGQHDDHRVDANGRSQEEREGPLPKRPRPLLASLSAAEIAEEFSHHDPQVARVNNGSFGCCPASVVSAQIRWQRLFLRQPDEFYFRHLHPSIDRSRALVRQLINAPHLDDVSLVDNATTAAAIVFQNVAWSFMEGVFDRGDAVVMLHYAYGAVKRSIKAYVGRAGGHVVEVALPFPLSSPDEVVAEFRRALELCRADGRRVRLAVIDHVTSMPSVVIPVKELTRICREEGVDQVFVDGAHSIGNVEVDMQDIGADFYASNLHKWLFCPPSVAFLHTRHSSAAGRRLHHPVVSHEYGNGLPLESGWIGNRDYTPQLVVPTALEFAERFEGGLEGIRRRNHERVVEMGRMLAAAWGTQLGCPPEMSCSMIMVGLPSGLGIASEKDAMGLRALLREEFKVEVPIYYNKQSPDEDGEDKIGAAAVTGYARISHQVYNVAEDYYRLRDAINKLVRDGFNCTLLPSKEQREN